LDHLLAGLDRMRTASDRLNTFVKTFIEGASSGRQHGQALSR
jgi:hypothetical protein